MFTSATVDALEDNAPVDVARRRRVPPKRLHKVQVDLGIMSEGETKLDELIIKLGLEKPEQPYNPFDHQTVKHNAKTVGNYENLWAEMRKFYFLIGDYQSAMLVDRKRCPKKPLPFRPQSFALYLDYRFGTPGGFLIEPGTGNHLKDVRGRDITIVGGWTSPSSCYKIHSAVLFLHRTAYPETCGGPYVVNCPDCESLNAHLGTMVQGTGTATTTGTGTIVENTEDDDDDGDIQNQDDPTLERAVNALVKTLGLFRSCVTHAMNPNLRSSGNILEHPPTKKHYDAWLKLKKSQHVTKGNGQLYPSEVRAIRNHLLYNGDPISIQHWVMTLLGIKMFLRSDEIINLTVEDFVNSYYPKAKIMSLPDDGKQALTKCQVVHPDSVRACALEVQGKRDAQPVRLALIIDQECPEFCALRHLLWYMKVFNIRSGYLFPPSDVLIDAYEKGEPVDSDKRISYGSFLWMMKHLIRDVCKRDCTIFQVGTHTLRKTAYLFAVWGFLGGMRAGAYADEAIPRKSFLFFDAPTT
jgi:hypothetical protein